MFGFLKDRFEKEAQAAIERRARQLAPKVAPKAVAAKPLPPPEIDREQAIAHMQAKVQSPERAELIRQAMQVHRAKQKILDELDDESRAKLLAMAITTMLRQK